MLYKWLIDIYEEDREGGRWGGGGEKRARKRRRRGGRGEEEENYDEDDEDNDCVCHSVNKMSNCSHISFFAKTTLLNKRDSTNTD